MHKLSSFLVLLSWSVLLAKEPNLAILQSVVSNDTQKFSQGKSHFVCKPYGVVTLEQLYNASTIDSLCRKSVDGFYAQDPNMRYFSLRLLKPMQTYHVEFQNKSCVLYAKGEKTLSELLLAEGLAFIKPAFDDEVFNAVFFKAQMTAKLSKKGLWRENILKECMVESKL